MDQTDFGAYRLPIIPREAVEEKFDQLGLDEQAQLEKIRNTITLKDEDF